MTATIARADTLRWRRHTQLSLGVATTAGLGLLVVGDVDPVHEMLSDSVRSRPGAALLTLAACALASAGGWLLAGARRILPPSPALTTLLTVWCASMLAVGFFPTNLPGTPPDAAAIVHRVGAALMAALPPLIGLLVARLAGPGRTRPLRAASYATMAACAAFAVVNGPAALFEQGLPPYAGLAERVLLALVLVVVALSAAAVDETSEPPRRPCRGGSDEGRRRLRGAGPPAPSGR